jgi:tetratricopeptide (TPR) repeat protein
MIMRIALTAIVVCLAALAGNLAINTATCVADAAQDRPGKEATAPPAASPDGLVLHEWGTFSTFSGSNGTNLKFQPYDDDLPEFVHGYMPRQSKQGPQGGTISLETPVLYFYSERPITASVQVDFPKGILTEWYPRATRTDHRLVWPEIKVLPKDNTNLLEEKKKNRYYAARETDAAPLRVAIATEKGRGMEQDKFLFYRGVGDFDLPLSVKAAGGGKFTVNWNGKAPEGDLVLVQVKAGKIRFQQFGLERKSGGATADVQVPALNATTKELGDALVILLTAKGLYEKEAKAMVKTWSSAWFVEEGTRVLYILPPDLTDELLPLKVEPKPTSLTRVLVGRHDVLTPEWEKQIDTWVAHLDGANHAPEAARRSAAVEMAKLGRYELAAQEASVLKMLEQQRDDAVKTLGANQATLALTNNLAERYVNAGRTREAVPHLAYLSAANPSDTMLSLKVAALQAWFGQDKELAATRQRVLAWAKNNNDARTAHRAVYCSGLRPSTDKAELQEMLALGRKAVDAGEDGQSYYLLALGMAEYRSGNDAAAEKALLAAEKALPVNPLVTGTSPFYRALILFRQGKVEEARKLATATAAKMKPLPQDENNPWTSADVYLIVWLAYKEAKAVIQLDAAPAIPLPQVQPPREKK